MLRRFGPAALIVVAGLVVYANSFRGVLILDDGTAITINESIRSLSTALSPPPNTSVSGRPIANLSFAINYLTGNALAGYHAVNLAIHLAAALVLLGILRRTLTLSNEWLALAVALVWTVHPLQTESVTYIVQRVESLAGLFMLLTLYASIRGWTLAAIVCSALAMGTKEVAVVTPLLVMLWFWTFRKRQHGALIGGLFATGLVLLFLVEPRGQTAGFGVGGWTSWDYLVTQTGVIVHYLRLMIWPDPLVFHYAWPKSSLADVWWQAILVASLFGFSLYGLKRKHPLGYAGAWFFLTLAPSSSFVPISTEVAAEHRVYLALAAVAGVVMAGVFRVVRDWRIGLAVAGIVAVLLGLETRARNEDYESESRMWRDTVIKQPGSPRAQLGYGVYLLQIQNYSEAEPHLRQAVAIEPHNPLAHRALGLSLAGRGRYAEAIPELQRALQLWPGDTVAQKVLSEIGGQVGR